MMKVPLIGLHSAAFASVRVLHPSRSFIEAEVDLRLPLFDRPCRFGLSDEARLVRNAFRITQSDERFVGERCAHHQKKRKGTHEMSHLDSSYSVDNALDTVVLRPL